MDDRGGVAAVFVVVLHEVAGCAVAADDKAVVADVVAVEIRGGTYSHSGPGCPTLDCYCYRTVHWIEVLVSWWHYGTGHVDLQSCHHLHHLCPQDQKMPAP